MKKLITLVVIGIILVIGGTVGGIASFVSFSKDPSAEAEVTLEFTSDYYADSIEPQTVYIDEGEYEIWYDTGSYGLRDPGDIIIVDSDGNLAFERSSTSSTTTSHGCKKVGSFEVKKSGEYTISVENRCKIYLTPPIDNWVALVLLFMGAAIGIIGGIIMLVGIYYYFTDKKERPQYPQHIDYQSQQPKQYPPPPPP